MYTLHGYHMPGTTKSVYEPTAIARCGGPDHCKQCKAEVADNIQNRLFFPERSLAEQPEDYVAKAKRLTKEYVDRRLSTLMLEDLELPPYEIYLVWFCKTLQNWKAMLGTTLEDNMYYEITYDGNERQAYVDAYNKTDNVIIRD